jgi:hypothetical protein
MAAKAYFCKNIYTGGIFLAALLQFMPKINNTNGE